MNYSEKQWTLSPLYEYFIRSHEYLVWSFTCLCASDFEGDIIWGDVHRDFTIWTQSYVSYIYRSTSILVTIGFKTTSNNFSTRYVCQLQLISFYKLSCCSIFKTATNWSILSPAVITITIAQFVPTRIWEHPTWAWLKSVVHTLRATPLIWWIRQNMIGSRFGSIWALLIHEVTSKQRAKHTIPPSAKFYASCKPNMILHENFNISVNRYFYRYLTHKTQIKSESVILIS